MPVLQALKQWLFQLRSDEHEPIILTQRRIFIVPTRSGLLFGAALCAMLIGAINYNLSLGHALVFLLAGVGLVTMLHTFRNLVKLHITVGHAQPVFAGEIALFPMFLKNTQPQVRRAIALAFGDHAPVSVDIAGRQQTAVAVPCPAPVRGRLQPGRMTLTSQYPLGLFYAWSYPHPRLSCLVYPRPIATPLPPAASVSDRGDAHGENGEEDFTGLRERQPNDSPRHIAWKAVARDFDHRPLLIKQFAGGAAQELWLDWSTTPVEVGVENRLSLLTGWVIAAQQANVHYGLRLPGRVVAPDHGAAHCSACLEILALYDEAR